jgi:hypothetical protein
MLSINFSTKIQGFEHLSTGDARLVATRWCLKPLTFPVSFKRSHDFNTSPQL